RFLVYQVSCYIKSFSQKIPYSNQPGYQQSKQGQHQLNQQQPTELFYLQNNIILLTNSRLKTLEEVLPNVRKLQFIITGCCNHLKTLFIQYWNSKKNQKLN